MTPMMIYEDVFIPSSPENHDYEGFFPSSKYREFFA